MTEHNIIAATNEYTVVTEYTSSRKRSSVYQSEADLETAFLTQLCEQGYEYLEIHSEDALISNLRCQLEKLNHYRFTDSEWERFFTQNIANPNASIEDKSQIIQEDNINVHDWNVTSKTNEEGTCIIKCKGIFEWRDENPVFMITNSNEAALISIEMRCNKNGKIAKISAME